MIACVCIYAAPAYSEEANPFAFQQSTQTNFSGSSYSSTVYQPFSNTTPAEYSASGMNSTDGYNPTYVHGPRKGKIDGPDTTPNDYPIGEPWVMLAFAALAAGFIAYNRKKEPTLTLPKGKE